MHEFSGKPRRREVWGERAVLPASPLTWSERKVRGTLLGVRGLVKKEMGPPGPASGRPGGNQGELNREREREETGVLYSNRKGETGSDARDSYEKGTTGGT